MPVKLDFEIPGRLPEVPVVYGDIRDMIYNYRSTDPTETKSGWVSASEVLQLLADNNANGIRIHFGRHLNTDPLYPGKRNVILVATRDTVNPDSPATENSNDLLNYIKSAGPINSVVAGLSYTGMGDDAIPLCPPRCPLKPAFP